MYLSETLARDRHQDTIERARHEQQARRASDVNRLHRRQLRAERRMMSAWQRSDELRTMLEASL
jgi:hypothetical protein